MIAGADHLIASGMMAVFEKIWPDVWSARMQYILNNALLALLEFPDATLLGIMRMLSDKKYRKEVVDNLKDPVVKRFWVNEFGQYTDRFATEAVAAIQNKVGQFVANPLIRNVIGQPHSSLNPRKIMDEGKILIVNLSKGRIGEDNSSLLGAMMITRLQLAAMSRVDIPNEEDRRDFYLYIDEFQNFSTESFANILSEARKYRLNLTLAHQYISQLVGENTRVRDAIFGNVGTFVIFRVGPEDAEFLEGEFLPTFEASDLVSLPKYQVYTRLMIDGVAGKPFSAETIEPRPRPENSFADVIIENSRRRYSTRREDVEKKIGGEWLSESDAIKEKVERRTEKGLEILERRQPKKKDKSKPNVDKDRLRSALSRDGQRMFSGGLVLGQKDLSGDKSIDPGIFSDINGRFIELEKKRGRSDASNSPDYLESIEGEIIDQMKEINQPIGGIIFTLGSFLGETLIKNLGGEWKWSPKQNRWVVSVKTSGGYEMEFNVFRKVENRVNHGAEDSLDHFYKMTKMVLEKGHEAILEEDKRDEAGDK